MGGSKKVTVGYKYYLGMHMVLCHGPVDRLNKIIVGDKVAWTGQSEGGSISINRPDLFGGEDVGNEGGISGTVELAMGEPDQAANTYLAARMNGGGAIPAFRGVVSAILHQCYLGTSQYIKPWVFEPTRIFTRQDGIEQWYPERAEVGSVELFAYSAGWEWQTGAGTDAVADPGSFAVPSGGWNAEAPAPFGHAGSGSTVEDDYYPIDTPWNPQDWLWLRKTVTITVAPQALNLFVLVENACYVYWDGQYVGSVNPTNNQTTAFERVTIPIDASLATVGDHVIAIYCLDDEPDLGVSDTTYFFATLSGSFQADMNPAHIIRECLTDPDWGLGYLETDVDDDAFADAADTLYGESMGMSLIWDRQIPLQDFIQEIVRHINAALYVDRVTGKFVLKLIRADYDPDAILELGEGDIERVEGFKRPTVGELINSVTVNYWDPEKRDTGSVTVHDQALVQMQQATINTTVQYQGFTNSYIATIAAQRDLKTLSTPLASCTVYATRKAGQLTVGDVFKMQWPDLDIVDVVMRVQGIAFGDGRSNKIKLTVCEDVFSTPTVAVTGDPGSPWEDPSQDPEPVTHKIVQEQPYYEVVQQLGQADADLELDANPDYGLVGAAAGKPNESCINAQLHTDPGSGYENVATVDFSPYALLDGAMTSREQTVVPLTGATDVDLVEVGTFCQCDDEIMYVEALTETSMTVRRGCLDTVPALHLNGAAVLFWDANGVSDPTAYSAADEVDVKLLPVAGQGILDISLAAADTVTLDSRAIRPYPAANWKVNDAYWTDTISGAAQITNTWAHRNRVQQTSPDLLSWYDAGVTVEDGVTYTLRLVDEADVTVDEITGITGTSQDIDPPPSSGTYTLELESVRDGYTNFFPLRVQFDYTTSLPDDELAASILGKLRGYWSMDESTGATVIKDDWAGNDLRVVNSGNITFEGTTVRGGGSRAVRFASTGRASLNGVPLWSGLSGLDCNLTLHAWFRPDAVTSAATRALLCNATADDTSATFNFTARVSFSTLGEPNWFWEYGVGADKVLAGYAPALPDTTGRLHTFVRDHDNLSVRHYVNGALSGFTTYSSGESPTGGTEVNNEFTLGNTEDEASPALGYMQDVMALGEPLTGDEMAYLYNGGTGRSLDDIKVAAGLPTNEWTPSALNGKALWLKSDDPAHLSSGGLVTAVNNLCGCGYGAVSTGNGARNDQLTLNGRAVLTATATDTGEYVFAMTTKETKAMSGITIAAVHRMRVADGATGLKVLVGVNRGGAIDGLRADLSRSSAIANDVRMGGRRTDAAAFNSQVSGSNHGTNWLITVGNNDYTTGVGTIYNDGTLAVTSGAIYGTGASDNTDGRQGIMIGRYSGGNTHANYHLAEVVVVAGNLTSTEREKLEGYLAHKWGLTAGLPALHPYKSTPPTL